MRLRALTIAALLTTGAALTLAPAALAGGPPVKGSLDAQVAMGPSLHPSGNDRTEEKGGSGTQGKSPSDPDGNYNYGDDKPGGDGGVYTGDQDGNNGCGNDQDFEDDNNGNCGGKRPTDECIPTDSSGTVVDVHGKSAGKGNGANAAGEPCDDPNDTSDSEPDPNDTSGLWDYLGGLFS